MSAKIHRLVQEFIDLTDEMNELADQRRALSARRDQVALQLSHTGMYLHQIGRLVGLAAPTLCRIIQKAKAHNDGTEQSAGDGYPERVSAQR